MKMKQVLRNDFKVYSASFSIILLLSLSIIQLVNALPTWFPHRNQDEEQKRMDSFMESLAINELAPTSLCLPVSQKIDENMDRLLEGLSRATEENSSLRESLRNAIRMEDFHPIDDSKGRQRVHRTDLSLLNALEEDTAQNPHVLHQSDMWRKLRQIETVLESNPPNDQQLFEDAIREEYGDEAAEEVLPELGLVSKQPKLRRRRSTDNAPGKNSSSGRSFSKQTMSFLKHLMNIGVNTLHYLHMAPEFLNHIPTIGDAIREMRKRSEPAMKVINFMRRAQYLFKVRNCPDAMKKLDPKMKCEEYDRAEYDKSLRIVGEMGVEAAQLIVDRLFGDRKFSDDDKKEALTRVLNYALTYLAPSSQTVCKFLGK